MVCVCVGNTNWTWYTFLLLGGEGTRVGGWTWGEEWEGSECDQDDQGAL